MTGAVGQCQLFHCNCVGVYKEKIKEHKDTVVTKMCQTEGQFQFFSVLLVNNNNKLLVNFSFLTVIKKGKNKKEEKGIKRGKVIRVAG